MSNNLQPLRITSGWSVCFNTFNEVDPSEDTIHEFQGSSLLILRNENANRLIDLSWRPENDVNGHFLLNVLNTFEVFNSNKNTLDYETDWEHPFLVFESSNRIEVVTKLEQLMLQLPPFEDPRILKNRGVIDLPSETFRLAFVNNGLTEELFKKILSEGNRQLQELVIDLPDLPKEYLKIISDQGCTTKVKNKAITKLRSKKHN